MQPQIASQLSLLCQSQIEFYSLYSGGISGLKTYNHKTTRPIWKCHNCWRCECVTARYPPRSWQPPPNDNYQVVTTTKKLMKSFEGSVAVCNTVTELFTAAAAHLYINSRHWLCVYFSLYCTEQWKSSSKVRLNNSTSNITLLLERRGQDWPCSFSLLCWMLSEDCVVLCVSARLINRTKVLTEFASFKHF